MIDIWDRLESYQYDNGDEQAAAYNADISEAAARGRKVERMLAMKQDDWIEACQEIDRLREALKRIRNELGVPGPGYPQPVANAVDIAREALAAINEGRDDG